MQRKFLKKDLAVEMSLSRKRKREKSATPVPLAVTADKFLETSANKALQQKNKKLKSEVIALQEQQKTLAQSQRLTQNEVKNLEQQVADLKQLIEFYQSMMSEGLGQEDLLKPNQWHAVFKEKNDNPLLLRRAMTKRLMELKEKVTDDPSSAIVELTKLATIALLSRFDENFTSKLIEYVIQINAILAVDLPAGLESVANPAELKQEGATSNVYAFHEKDAESPTDGIPVPDIFDVTQASFAVSCYGFFQHQSSFEEATEEEKSSFTP